MDAHGLLIMRSLCAKNANGNVDGDSDNEPQGQDLTLAYGQMPCETV